jgi:hypothetical protein
MNATDSQATLPFGDSITERFAAWKVTPGGRHVLKWMYQIASGCFKDFVRYGLRASQRWIWEEMRRRIGRMHAYLAKRGWHLAPENGFTLNNDFTAHAVRHMLANHPEWGAMFETRALGKPRLVKRTTIVKTELVMA